MTRTKRQCGGRGVALLLVVFTIALVAAQLAAIHEVATTDLVILRNHASGLRALYAAQAGLGAAVAALRADPAAANPCTGTLTAPDGRSSTYQAAIENNQPVVTVTSIGAAEGFQRKVQARLIVTGPPTVSPYPVRIVWWKEMRN